MGEWILATRQVIRAVFPPEQHEHAETLLAEECGTNLPLCDGASGGNLERIRFAVLKLSAGDLERLRKWIGEAQTDWRDVLMAAGFGHSLTAHEEWLATESSSVKPSSGEPGCDSQASTC